MPRSIRKSFFGGFAVIRSDALSCLGWHWHNQNRSQRGTAYILEVGKTTEASRGSNSDRTVGAEAICALHLRQAVQHKRLLAGFVEVARLSDCDEAGLTKSPRVSTQDSTRLPPPNNSESGHLRHHVGFTLAGGILIRY